MNRKAQIAPSFGDYAFGRELAAEGREEMSIEEISTLRDGEPGFLSEEVTRAPQVTFGGLVWDTILGLVDKKIYKVSLFFTGSKHQADAALQAISSDFDEKYVRVSSPTPFVTIWDCSDGNIIMHAVQSGMRRSVVITSTSNAVRHFVKIDGRRASNVETKSGATRTDVPVLSSRGARRIGALLFLLFWSILAYISIATKLWLALRVPLGIVAFICVFFGMNELLKATFGNLRG